MEGGVQWVVRVPLGLGLAVLFSKGTELEVRDMVREVAAKFLQKNAGRTRRSGDERSMRTGVRAPAGGDCLGEEHGTADVERGSAEGGNLLLLRRTGSGDSGETRTEGPERGCEGIKGKGTG